MDISYPERIASLLQKSLLIPEYGKQYVIFQDVRPLTEGDAKAALSKVIQDSPQFGALCKAYEGEVIKGERPDWMVPEVTYDGELTLEYITTFALALPKELKICTG